MKNFSPEVDSKKQTVQQKTIDEALGGRNLDELPPDEMRKLQQQLSNMDEMRRLEIN